MVHFFSLKFHLGLKNTVSDHFLSNVQLFLFLIIFQELITPDESQDRQQHHLTKTNTLYSQRKAGFNLTLGLLNTSILGLDVTLFYSSQYFLIVTFYDLELYLYPLVRYSLCCFIPWVFSVRMKIISLLHLLKD